jgi:DNA replication protein DnaC
MQESTPESQNSEPEVPDWKAEQRLRRIEACRKLRGLTDRELLNAGDKFEITDDNMKAYEAARELPKTLGANLVFCGKAGRGKSRLAHGIVVAGAEAGIHSVFWTTSKFLMTLRDKSLETSEIQALKEMCTPQILVLDDFGANKITEWSLMMMDTVIDDWYRAGRKGLVITSNYSIAKIATEISDRIASRLAEMCDIFDMKGKDWRVR